MIIIKLQGGLGNQMFQYALGRNLSLIHGKSFKVDYSYLKIPNQSQRTLEIDGYNTMLEKASEKEILSYTSMPQKILDLVRSNKKLITEKKYVFDPKILLLDDGYFSGHWNSEKYFKKNEATIREDFKLKKHFCEHAEIISKKIISSTNSVSVHIRRGDYAFIKKIADIHGILPISYYEHAMELLVSKLSNPIFFIFSDDIEWARTYFPKKYPLIFVSNSLIPNYEELILMSQCKNNIIANSTFSWWASWLNTNKEKIVIAPKKWFVTNIYTNEDLVQKDWIQI